MVKRHAHWCTLPARSSRDRNDRLNQQVLAAGVRVHLATDARLDRTSFEQMYPELERWKAVRRDVDPWLRLGL